jgi:agmatine deiminase
MPDTPPARRGLLATLGFRTAGMAAEGFAVPAGAAPGGAYRTGRLRVPADDVPHTQTWMSWPADRSIWGRQLRGVQQDIALIARTVARFEPVVMCAADEEAAYDARTQCGPGILVRTDIPTDDLWMRDTCAVFRTDGAGRLDAIGLNFNGWGDKQKHRDDAYVAQYVAESAGLRFGWAEFVGEGGAVETDGDGTVMATESSLVNKNRNRGMSKSEIERAVLDAYGADKMIWVPGIKGRDITDDHIDVTSRFVRPGVVMVQLPPPGRNDAWARDAREQHAILSAATDAKGRRLQVITVEGPDDTRSRNRDLVDSYLNFHVVNGGLITAQFGDPAKDTAARAALAAAFPGRHVIQLDVDRLMGGGGGIHCSTMQQPAA